jgi:pyruvate-ferredoxin/flavodoxin oxidoreductase
MARKMSIVDGNEAAAAVAYRLNEVIAIYPITPSSPMGEWSDQWNAERKQNIWGAIPDVIEMQSEGGAAGAPTARYRPGPSARHSPHRKACF